MLISSPSKSIVIVKHGLFFNIAGNELLDVTAYGLRSDFLSPETMPKATVELALTKNRKLLLASVLGAGIHLLLSSIINLLTKIIFLFLLSKCEKLSRCEGERARCFAK